MPVFDGEFGAFRDSILNRKAISCGLLNPFLALGMNNLVTYLVVILIVQLPEASCSSYLLVLDESPTIAWDEQRLHEQLDNVSLQKELECSFGCSLSPASHFEIHRYVAGDGIGPHTDAGALEVRCILNLSSNWCSHQGNVWIFASDSALVENRLLLPSISNSAYAFPTAPTSYHALSVRRYGVDD
ncbi:MAG: hypothetical protein JWP25_6077 [Bradyrhizobium sp.]|nr:hypothetical protein [Bradyrhizobium sp.]